MDIDDIDDDGQWNLEYVTGLRQRIAELEAALLSIADESYIEGYAQGFVMGGQQERGKPGEMGAAFAVLEAALRETEWGMLDKYDEAICPACHARPEEGHDEDCIVGRALHEHGGDGGGAGAALQGTMSLLETDSEGLQLPFESADD